MQRHSLEPHLSRNPYPPALESSSNLLTVPLLASHRGDAHPSTTTAMDYPARRQQRESSSSTPLCYARGLCRLDPLFYRSARVRSNNRRVDHHAFHIGFRCEMLEHRCPDAAFRPSIKTLINGVPLAVFAWQKSPLRSAAGHPEDTGDEVLAGQWVADVEV